MTTTTRVQNEPAWLLHRRPFRDTSQILDVLSRDHGRISLVARGSRGARSKLKGILRPFLPLNISWVARSDLGTLTGAEMHGAPIALIGDGLMSGYYINELLLNLLHRHDPQPDVFFAYSTTVRNLAGCEEVTAELRLFEMELLRMLGYALNLDHDTTSRESLDESQHYEYQIERGLVPVDDAGGPLTFSGAVLAGINRREFEDPEILQNATRLLREVVAFHLGDRELKSRKVLLDMRRAAQDRNDC